MRFTDAQVALFRAGISFVNMSPTVWDQEKAFEDFRIALVQQKVYIEGYTWYNLWDHGHRTKAYFAVCAATGCCLEHVPVLFWDSPEEEYKDRRAYEDAKYIPAPVGGLGPMTVR